MTFASQRRGDDGLEFDSGLDRAAGLLLVLAAVLLAVCSVQAGITFDEPECAANGRRILRFWLDGGSGYDATAADLMRYQGGAFDLPCAVVERLVPFPAHHVRHAFTSCAALLLAFATWRLGRTAGGSLAGLAALGLLLLLPGFWAHGTNNPKDIPFAAGAACSLWLLLRLVPRLPQVRWHEALLLGSVLGATTGARVGGFLFAGIGAVLLFACTIAEARVIGPRAALRAAIASGCWIVLGFCAVLAVVWPWILESPLARIRESLAVASSYPWPDTLLFEGNALRLHEVPWTYVPVMLSATAPMGLALVWSVGVACAGFTRARLAALLCFAAAVIPVGLVLAGHGFLYDGLRHLFFVVPALAVLGGLGCARAAQLLPRRASAVLLLTMTALAAWHVPTLVRLHPYEVAYFSEVRGGLAAAEGRFDTDYWVASYREAAEWLAEHAPAKSAHHADGRHRVKVALRSATVAPFLPADRFVIVDAGAQADWFIAATRWNAADRHAGREVHRIARDGVAFCIVKDLRPTPK